MILAGFFILVLGVASVFSYQAVVVQINGLPQDCPVIIVDAGHGGLDGGAVGRDGTVEKDINLAISKYLRDVLQCMGFQVVMTREGDGCDYDPGAKSVRAKKVSDTRNRLNLAKKTEHIAFVSIHLNIYQGKARGTQTFYSPNHPASKELAQLVQDSVYTHTGQKVNRTIKKINNNIYLLYHMPTPAVLVECGFMSDKEELALLKTSEYQQKLAVSIAGALVEYYQLNS